MGVLNLSDMSLVGSVKKLHKMPVTAIAYNSNDNALITASVDYSYLITPLNTFSLGKFLMNIIMSCGLLLLVLLIFSDRLLTWI